MRGNLLDFGSQSRCVEHVLPYASPGPHRISVLFRTGHSSIYKYSRFVRRCSPSGKVVIYGQFVMYKRLSEVRSPTDSGKAYVPGQFGISSWVSDVRLSAYCSKFITSGHLDIVKYSSDLRFSKERREENTFGPSPKTKWNLLLHTIIQNHTYA